MQHADLKPVVAPISAVPACASSEYIPNGAIVGIVGPEEERPIPVTELIFAPRKKEMNKGFLMFSQDEGLTSESHLKPQRLGTRYCFIAFESNLTDSTAIIKFLFAVLKDEPEDLTHLAPTAGDACIPLENSPFDMFDDFILNDNYCSLLGDDLTNTSPVDPLTPDPILLSSPEPQVSNMYIANRITTMCVKACNPFLFLIF